ncbi:MAG: GFA family protein [Rhizobacter sp.]
MAPPSSTRLGGCRCGSVRFALTGEPKLVGLCHCKTCRKETGSVAMAYAVWDTARFTTGGETRTWEGRDFCPRCGTRLYSMRADEHEVEVKLGALDVAPCGLTPTEEIWIKRREPWMSPVPGAKQYEQDPVEVDPTARPVAAARRKPASPRGDEGAPVGTGTPVTARKLPRSSGQAGAKKG